jgi:hypothetical protein
MTAFPLLVIAILTVLLVVSLCVISFLKGKVDAFELMLGEFDEDDGESLCSHGVPWDECPDCGH